MPSNELLNEYHQLLAAEGLSSSRTTTEQWIQILSTEQAVAATRFHGLRPVEPERVASIASHMARFGTLWNFRIQQLVPDVVEATRV